MNDTRIGGNMFSFFRKKNNQPLPSLSPADLPEDILIHETFWGIIKTQIGDTPAGRMNPTPT